MNRRRGPSTAGQGVSKRAALVKLAGLAALVLSGVLAVRFTPLGDFLSREGIAQLTDAVGTSMWAPLVFIAIYAGATALAVPGTILTLAGGALFGVVWGTVYNSVAANIGANLAFLVARFLGRDGVQRLTGERLSRLDKATRAHGFRGLLTLRLIPLVPFNALNFGSGLTALSWPSYAIATAVGILPGTIVYTNFADALLAGSQEASREALVRVLVSGGLLVILSFLPLILRKMKVSLPGATVVLFLSAAVLPEKLSATVGQDAPSTSSDLAELAPASRLPDHQAFSAVLSEVVHGSRVDYAALSKGREGLDGYLETLGAVAQAELEAASSAEQLAFWINAYNACMLRLVIDHYPIERASGLLDRVRNAIAGRPANSVWQIDDAFTEPHCVVAGEARSQDEIEHEIVRPMGDPRIHFVINCAALSCPPLTSKAYTAPELDEQLDERVRAFVANEEHFVLGEGELRLNRVLDWFQDDFGGLPGLKEFFEPYLDSAAREEVADPQTRIEFFDYDWTLNDIEP